MNKIRFIASFGDAARGIASGAKSGRNLRIQIIAGIYCLLISPFFLKTKGEWVAVIITVSLIPALELLNTAIERICDLVNRSYHPEVKFIKDLAAGAVLLVAVGAAIIGFILFLSPDGWLNLIEFSKTNIWYPIIAVFLFIPSGLFIFGGKIH